MPYFEHTATVVEPVEHVAAVLTAPEVGDLFAPPIVRVTLDASDDGRAADLSFERHRTTATGPRAVDEHGRTRRIRITAPFSGPGIEGSLTYRLVPQGDATELVQVVEYEFSAGAAIDLLEWVTTEHNDRQFAAQLTTVTNLIEPGSRARPAARAA